jgi:hypothetical protein
LDLQSPTLLLTAWVLVPAAVGAASAGLGYGVSLLARLPLRGLMLPTGFLTGIFVFAALYRLGVTGVAGVALMVALALAGPVYALARGRRPRRPAPGDERRGLIWAAVAGVGGYAVALAPLAGSGRSGILGYVLNDDSAIHVSLSEALADGHTSPVDVEEHSYGSLTRELTSGYPIGSYAWPVFGRVLGSTDAFHLWAPMIAVAVGMIALVAYVVLRSLRAGPVYAGIAAVFASCGHLVYAYNAQGGYKELIMPVAIYATAGLLALALEAGMSGRNIVPAGLTAAGGVANLGYAAAAWVGPIVVGALAVLVWRHLRGDRIRNVRGLVLYAVVAALLALPAAISSIEFFRRSQQDLRDPNEVGNLFDALSLWQMLGTWLTGDYRVKPPDLPGFTYTALSLALALAVLGLVVAVVRRNVALPLALLGGIAGVLLVTPRTSIYYDAKTYVALAPALGMATAAGVLLLWNRAWKGAFRVVAVLAAGTVAVGIVWSDVLIYQHVWVTPKDRLHELDRVAERFEGEGPTLVSDRDQYSVYFLRDIGPWDDWGYRQPQRGLRFANNVPPQPPVAPDMDHYTLEHLSRFELLLDRKAPGGSRAPTGFEAAFETAHYRVWRRSGALPDEHLPLGRDGRIGAEHVRCRRGRPRNGLLEAFAQQADERGSPLVAAIQSEPSIVAIEPEDWANVDFKRAVPAPGTAAGRGGRAQSVELLIEPGRYEAWMQGSFGPGVRLYTVPYKSKEFVNIGDAFNDLGTPAWQRMGVVDIERRTTLVLGGIGRPWWLSGSKHFNIMGRLEIRREGAVTRLETIPPGAIGRLCGRWVDWVERPA